MTTEEEIKKKLLFSYEKELKKFRMAVAMNSCTSTRDFLHGKVTKIREVIQEIYGPEAPELLRSVEGN